MKRNEEDLDELPEEVDFTGAHRGHFAGRLNRDTLMVVIDPELTEKFPDSAAVNEALRFALKVREQDAA